MASANLDLVRTLIPAPEVEIAALLRDDRLFEQLEHSIEPLIHPEFEATAAWREGTVYRGIDGFRQMWLDWMEPWATYHVEVDELIDLDQRVVALIRDRARRHDTDREFELVSGSIWEFRDGRLIRAEFFRDRDETLRAAGLSE